MNKLKEQQFLALRTIYIRISLLLQFDHVSAVVSYILFFCIFRKSRYRNKGVNGRRQSGVCKLDTCQLLISVNDKIYDIVLVNATNY